LSVAKDSQIKFDVRPEAMVHPAMLRDKNLIPLSRQHQHALALCVRIERGQPIPEKDLHSWQFEIEEHFEHEIKVHFLAEETAVFPVARRFLELAPLVEELLAEHASLREWFSQAEARRLSAENLPVFARELSAHIRKEERQLFERLQELLSSKELDILGKRLEGALAEAEQSCILPSEATKLRAK
jgi:hemerythrin-like domain-containing protein